MNVRLKNISPLIDSAANFLSRNLECAQLLGLTRDNLIHPVVLGSLNLKMISITPRQLILFGCLRDGLYKVTKAGNNIPQPLRKISKDRRK